jgi:hypothetical protein
MAVVSLLFVLIPPEEISLNAHTLTFVDVEFRVYDLHRK